MKVNTFREKTVCLFVKLHNGQWIMDDDSPLPEIREGARAELVVSSSAIPDDAVLAELTEARRVLFLEKGQSLWAQVDGTAVPRELDGIVKDHCQWAPRGSDTFVEIILKEDLFLILRANKFSKLAESECFIPGLEQDARSVNHAYTLISTACEPRRRSHSGNVFDKVYYGYQFRDTEYLRPLNDRRLEISVICASREANGKTKDTT